MNDEQNKTILRCDCHAKHARAIDEFDNDMRDNRKDHGAMWDEIRNRVSHKLFVTFVTLTFFATGTLFGFLWNMNSNLKDAMSDIKSELAIISTKIEFHTEKMKNGGP